MPNSSKLKSDEVEKLGIITVNGDTLKFEGVVFVLFEFCPFLNAVARYLEVVIEQEDSSFKLTVIWTDIDGIKFNAKENCG